MERFYDTLRIVKHKTRVDLVVTNHTDDPRNLVLTAILAGASPNIVKQLGWEVPEDAWEKADILRRKFSDLLWDAEETFKLRPKAVEGHKFY